MMSYAVKELNEVINPDVSASMGRLFHKVYSFNDINAFVLANSW